MKYIHILGDTMSDKGTITSVKINNDLLEKMDAIKEKLGLPKKYIINEAIKEYLENHNFETIEF